LIAILAAACPALAADPSPPANAVGASGGTNTGSSPGSSEVRRELDRLERGNQPPTSRETSTLRRRIQNSDDQGAIRNQQERQLRRLDRERRATTDAPVSAPVRQGSGARPLF